VLAKKGAKWIVAAEIVETTKLYARTVARHEPQWLEEVARIYQAPLLPIRTWEKKARRWRRFERSTLLWPAAQSEGSACITGPMNVEESRKVFIRRRWAGRIQHHAPFFAHNQKADPRHRGAGGTSLAAPMCWWMTS